MTVPWKKRFFVGLGLFAVFAALLLAYAHASRYYPVDSDNANVLLWARDVISGNLLLSGWYLGTVSYYFSDILFFTLALLVLPFKASTIHNVYAILYALSVAVFTWLAGRRGPQRWDWLGACAAFAVLAFPADSMGRYLLMGPMHMATFLWVALALIALDFAPVDQGSELSDPSTERNSTRSLPWLRLALASLFLSLALISDTIVLYMAVVPILVISALRLLRLQGNRRVELAVLGSCVAAVVLAKLFDVFVTASGGFILPENAANLKAAFIDFPHLGENIQYTLHSLLLVFNANFFGMPVGLPTSIQILGFVGLSIIVYTAYRLLGALVSSLRPEPEAASRRQNPDRIATVACLGILIDVFCYAISNQASGIASIRYLLPTLLYGGLLVGRYGVPQWRMIRHATPRREWAAAFCLACFSWLYVFTSRAVQQPLVGPSPMKGLAQWLRARDLTDGYGTYWAANIVTLESGGAVRVRPVLSPAGNITPFRWVAREDWYHNHRANFLVVEYPTFGSVDVKRATEWFGPAAERHEVYGYTVLVWNRDISPRLYLEQDPQKP
ncbi:MAG: hypothetical protein H7Z41_09010 [Cytophagales bacterium]|nr:hypothetical protein [Armatimonadota bacterium]